MEKIQEILRLEEVCIKQLRKLKEENGIDKTLRNITIENIVEKEYYNVVDNYEVYLDKNPKSKQSHVDATNKMLGIIEELYLTLPKEKHYLVSQFEEVAILNMGIEAKVLFKEGVILGLTKLSYLSEFHEDIKEV